MLFEMLTSLSVELITPKPDPDKFGILDPGFAAVGVVDTSDADAAAFVVADEDGSDAIESGIGGSSLVDMSMPEADEVEAFSLGVDGPSPLALSSPMTAVAEAADEAALWR